MNGVDRTKFDRTAVVPYKDRRVTWHGQVGSFRDDAQGNLAWTPDSGANLGSNGIEDITGKLGVSSGQAGGQQYQYDPATGGVTSTGAAPAPPSPGPGEGQPPPPSPGPGQQVHTKMTVGDEADVSGIETDLDIDIQGLQQPGVSGTGPVPTSIEGPSQQFRDAFGKAFGDPGYQANFDFNADNKIDNQDLLILGADPSVTEIDPVTQAQQFGGLYSQELGYHTPEEQKNFQIDTSIQSMISTAGDQRTATGQPYSPEYYSRYQDGYRTYLQGLKQMFNLIQAAGSGNMARA